MFTGLIEATAKVLAWDGSTLSLTRPSIFIDCTIGSSIAVSGVCLSIVALDALSMTFTVVPETLKKTHLKNLKPNDEVNVERAMSLKSRIEGHIVQGHVEGVATVVSCTNISQEFKKEQSNTPSIERKITIQFPRELLQGVVPQGSIAIDGVSLTVADVQDDYVTVALIPHTLTHTTLGRLVVGSEVTIETDILAKYAQKLMQKNATL